MHRMVNQQRLTTTITSEINHEVLSHDLGIKVNLSLYSNCHIQYETSFEV